MNQMSVDTCTLAFAYSLSHVLFVSCRAANFPDRRVHEGPRRRRTCVCFFSLNFYVPKYKILQCSRPVTFPAPSFWRVSRTDGVDRLIRSTEMRHGDPLRTCKLSIN
jgi:hypothetical protein